MDRAAVPSGVGCQWFCSSGRSNGSGHGGLRHRRSRARWSHPAVGYRPWELAHLHRQLSRGHLRPVHCRVAVAAIGQGPGSRRSLVGGPPRNAGAGTTVSAGPRPGVRADRATKTSSRPGRSGASRTSRTSKPAETSDQVISSRWRNRKVEADTNRAPSSSKRWWESNVTNGGLTSASSTHDCTDPIPAIDTRLKVRSRVHSAQARRAGLRVSNTRWPPGFSAARIPASVSDQSVSARKTWATLPVIVAMSTVIAGRVVASPNNHRTRFAPGFRRATSSDARAGSTATTSQSAAASLHANVPVPHPTSRTTPAPNSMTIDT